MAFSTLLGFNLESLDAEKLSISVTVLGGLEPAERLVGEVRWAWVVPLCQMGWEQRGWLLPWSLSKGECISIALR